MAMNQVQPAGFSSLVHQGEDKQGASDPRLECEDVPLYDDQQVMDKLMSIINQLGDLKAIKLGEKEQENKEDPEAAQNAQNGGSKAMITNNINKKIQDMINDINEKGYIIHPNGKFKMIWDTIMAIALLWSITVSPIRISILFEEDLIALDLGDMLVDLLFLADFVLKFFTGYYQYGRLIKKKKKIAKRYLKNKFGFFIDLITSIPLNFLVPNGPNSSLNFQPFTSVLTDTRTLQEIRATKMLRYLRIFKEIEGFVDILTFKRIKSVVMKKMCETFIVTVSYFIISACLWYLCGAYNKKDRDNWIFRLGYVGKDSWTILLASLYWTIQTIFTVGYGDMPALTKLEMVFSIFTQIFGSIILSYIYASMAIFIKYLNQEKESKRYTIDYLKKVRHKYNLPPTFIKALITKIKLETENLIEDLDLICDGLEPELIRVLKLSVFKKKYENAKAIVKKNDDFIFYFGSHFKIAEYKKSQIIMREGEPPTKMYFIAEGEVHLYQTSSIKTNTIKLDPKNSFGEIEYFRDEKKRLLNAKAMSDKVVCYTLSYEICQKLFPKMIEKEVEELKRQAERVFKRHLEQFNKASETKKKLDGESDSVMNENEASFQVDSRMGGSEAIMRSPESKRNGSNNPPDSAAKLMGEGSVKTINKSSFGN